MAKVRTCLRSPTFFSVHTFRTFVRSQIFEVIVFGGCIGQVFAGLPTESVAPLMIGTAGSAYLVADKLENTFLKGIFRRSFAVPPTRDEDILPYFLLLNFSHDNTLGQVVFSANNDYFETSLFVGCLLEHFIGCKSTVCACSPVRASVESRWSSSRAPPVPTPRPPREPSSGSHPSTSSASSSRRTSATWRGRSRFPRTCCCFTCAFWCFSSRTTP